MQSLSAPNIDEFHTKNKHINNLFQFIKSNKENQFIEYISNLTVGEIDVNARDENGNYLIFFSIMMNNRRILKKLIEYGVRLDVIDSDGYSVLYYPIKFNYFETIDILLEFNKKIIGISLVNLKDIRGYVPLFYAIKHKNIYAVQELLVNGADANYKNNDNFNSLHLAVLKKDVGITKMLLKHIKNINAKTVRGSTALHYACNFQLFDIAVILIENGADPNIYENEYDFTPIFYAVVQNNIPISKFLVDQGINPNFQDYNGNTIIHYCILSNHIEILDYIIERYAITSNFDNVFVDSIEGSDSAAKLAIKINPNIFNIDGLTMTHLMLYNYSEKYDKYIGSILPYCNLNYQDNIGNTLLHILVENDVWKKFKELLKFKKNNIFVKNNANKTVLDLVKLSEREEFIGVVFISYKNYLLNRKKDWSLKWQKDCSIAIIDPVLDKYCERKIKKDIVEKKASFPVKKNKTNIIVLQEELINFSTFTGSLLDLICGFKYLTKKYTDVTTLFHFNRKNTSELNSYNDSIGIRENPHQHLIHFEIRWIYQKIFFPPDFENTLIKILSSNKYKYIVIPIGIILSNGNHSNGLIYDVTNDIMERFEPHGSGTPAQFNYNSDLLDEILFKKMSNIVSNFYKRTIKIKYYQPKNYLPKIGFQTLETTEMNNNRNIGDPGGFCTLWTIWYIDHRLYYRGITPNQLVNNLIKQIKINNYSFRTLIRNYSIKITSLRDSYLSTIGKNINDYLNNKLNQEDLKNLLIEILTKV